MPKNYEWFLRADLTAYEGHYVAIANETVVASGDDPGEIYERAKALHPGAEVILWKVPIGEAFVFLVSTNLGH
ncbi:MAG: succinyl-CoA synthetase subunit alpha [Nitrospirae bacterium]|nr:succinyl-CoA synthetase subunit alpha [Nitrospirota bacterium]